MDVLAQVQILDKAFCISYRTNTHGNGINPIILLQALNWNLLSLKLALFHILHVRDWLINAYLYQVCVDTGSSLEDLLEPIDDRDGWRERVKEICAVRVSWWYIYIYIGGSLNKFPDFFRMSTFIDNTHMKL